MMKGKKPLTKVTQRPSHPDGKKYEFNCCASPDVWEYGDGSKKCAVCGKDWTEELN